MSQSLGVFITLLRQCESLEEERSLIAAEQADIRNYLRACEPEIRPRIVAKLIFIFTLGHNVNYGQMEVLTLMSHDQFSYKRIGYIGAALLLDESSELAVLLTHTVLKDLQSPVSHVQCLALTLIANVTTAEMCQSVLPEVQKLIDSGLSPVMKRAAMAAVRIVDKMPDLADSFKPTVQKLLKHGSHGVVICAIHLMQHMINAQPDLGPSYARYQPSLTKILKQLDSTKPSREFSFNIFNDPFLQMSIMKILGIVKKESDDLDDVLASIVTGVDVKRNTGRALLFHAVETIVATGKKQSLRGLAFSQIGKLFAFKEANVLYSALSVFSRVLYSGREIVDRTSADSIALQRYKTLIVHCLNHRDPSIRRRALDVICALVDGNNVETLVPEVLDYVWLAESEFRIELVAKIFTAIQRFAPTPKWNFDTVHRIILENGGAVGADLITTFCRLILHTPELQKYAVATLAGSLLAFPDNQTLLQVSAWVLGEFCFANLDVYDTLKKITTMPQTTAQTRGYIITAVAKLAVRFQRKDDAVAFFREQARSNSLDLQQRAGEFIKLFAKPQLCEAALAPLPSDGAGQPQRAQIVAEAADTPLLDMTEPGDGNLLSIADLPPTPAGQSLRDLVDIVPAQNQTQNQAQNQNQEVAKPFPGAVEALRKADYVVYFEIKKNPQNPKQMAIRASVFNLGRTEFKNFAMKFGATLGWGVRAQNPSSTTLEPIGGRPILQELLVGGQGDAKLQMKIQISYLYGAQPITEGGVVKDIFE
jgi:hypothetical protein